MCLNDDSKKFSIDNIIDDLVEKFTDLHYVYDNVCGVEDDVRDFSLIGRVLPSVNILLSEVEKYKNIDLEKYTHYNLKILNEYYSRNNYGLSSFSGLAHLGYSTLSISNNKKQYTTFLDSINKIMIKGANHYILSGTRASMHNCDCINGFGGVIRYLLHFKENNDVLETIRQLLTYLISLTLENKEVLGVKVPYWFLSAEEQLPHERASFPNGKIDLGLSHGITGVISILSIALLSGIEVKGQRSSIRRLLEFCYAYRMEVDNLIYWPRKIAIEDWIDGKKDFDWSRPSWCYGEAGISRTIYLAGKSLGDSYFVEDSIRVIISQANSNREDFGFISPTFCHGYSGLLQTLNVFYQDTKIESFLEPIDNITNKILSFYEKDAAFGFYDYEYKFNQEVSKNIDIGIVKGTTSILLPLLATIQYSKTNWDNMFLIN
ncbi:hypothetical protein CSC2_32000 [Clostridium zeae]|uniref:Uncharacterized protein n=1 Tax=Clostridium zeae TaxID=2759022 RepID=A0ABQ1ED07_9CLOT|nr:lanthionine synthetase C family protein [Clostridium zeae]GFZ32674.1 hypothetical protein CSC2_32000 [Clostridium zeae]